MPTRKQRRRQQKERRHEYEYVYVDDEGEEVEVDPAELKADRATKIVATRGSRRQPARRGGRVIQPPSLNRVLKRGLLFAPVMYLTLSLIGGGKSLSVPGRLLQTAILLAFFLPFSYVMDSVLYRSYVRRTSRQG